jgi:hypothetical protein
MSVWPAKLYRKFPVILERQLNGKAVHITVQNGNARCVVSIRRSLSLRGADVPPEWLAFRTRAIPTYLVSRV